MKKAKNISKFCYENPNPCQKYSKDGKPIRWHKPDCVIRAFCLATELPWQEGFDILCEIGRRIYDVPNSREVLDIALEEQGFTRVSFGRIKAGTTRPTVNSIADVSAGKVIVCNIAHHEVCVKDGLFFDTWDCGDCSVYSYWEKPYANK